MNIHEYQAKELLHRYGVPVQEGRVAFSADEAVEAARQLKPGQYVVKAQIHAGGRGKAGGVKLAGNLMDVRQTAGDILGKTLVTPQTGPAGKVVRKLLITEACEIKNEYYIGFVIDPALAKIVMIASGEGGVEIERVAQTAPEKIITVPVQPQIGLRSYQSRRAAEKIGIAPELTGQFVQMAESLYDAFVGLDCSAAEINPLVETGDHTLLALDAKVRLDDNALFRHPDLQALRDPDEEDPKELEASQYRLNYISLSGSIGCLVNGAGLAMATMDMIGLYGQTPANFLDIGGSATADKVTKAFQIILSDPNVKGILVNIFGGIMHCDVIANGIIEATKAIKVGVPLVVQLNGTNRDEGKRLLSESGLDIVAASSLADAVEKITGLVAAQGVNA